MDLYKFAVDLSHKYGLNGNLAIKEIGQDLLVESVKEDPALKAKFFYNFLKEIFSEKKIIKKITFRLDCINTAGKSTVDFTLTNKATNTSAISLNNLFDLKLNREEALALLKLKVANDGTSSIIGFYRQNPDESNFVIFNVKKIQSCVIEDNNPIVR